MSSREKNGNVPLIVTAVLLALICIAGAILLLSDRHPAETPQPQGLSFPETTGTLPQTTASTAAETVQTTVTTTAPGPHAAYLAFLNETLLPECGSAETEGAQPCSEQSGIAGVFFADLRDTGSDDMVVIRLDVTDGSTAALPVLLWYGETDGGITLFDTFEVKPQWSGYRIRRFEKELYLSGEFLSEHADTQRFTEIRLAFQNDPAPDLTMLDMQQAEEPEHPAKLYTEKAELLLEMQLDTAQPLTPLTERRYLLRNYMPEPAE